MTSFILHFVRVFAPSPCHQQLVRTGCLSKLYLSCRFASHKNVITIPKNFPGQKSSKPSKPSLLKKKSVRVSRSSERSEVSSKGTDGQYLTHTENEEDAGGQADELFQGEPRMGSGEGTSHFLPTDLGLSGTFIIKEKHVDKVVEDLRIPSSAEEITETEMQALQRNFSPEKHMQSEDLSNTRTKIISSELTETQKCDHDVNKLSSSLRGNHDGSQESWGYVGQQETIAIHGMKEEQLEVDAMVDSEQGEATTAGPNKIVKVKRNSSKQSHFKKLVSISFLLG